MVERLAVSEFFHLRLPRIQRGVLGNPQRCAQIELLPRRGRFQFDRAELPAVIAPLPRSIGHEPRSRKPPAHGSVGHRIGKQFGNLFDVKPADILVASFVDGRAALPPLDRIAVHSSLSDQGPVGLAWRGEAPGPNRSDIPQTPLPPEDFPTGLADAPPAARHPPRRAIDGMAVGSLSSQHDGIAGQFQFLAELLGPCHRGEFQPQAAELGLHLGIEALPPIAPGIRAAEVDKQFVLLHPDVEPEVAAADRHRAPGIGALAGPNDVIGIDPGRFGRRKARSNPRRIECRAQRVEPPFRMFGESLLVEVYAVMPIFRA